VTSSPSEKSAVWVGALPVAATWDVEVVWVIAAYLWFDVVPAERMNLGAVSRIYVRLLAECLVHNGSMCLGALPFAD
jgi:hypothetical protein